jgi:hypothetical protein
MVVDIKRALRYPPEYFLEAMPKDLLAGEQKINEYALPPNTIAVFQDFSFAALNDTKFKVDIDGVSDVVKMSDLGAVRGLDYAEDIKVPCTKRATFYIAPPASTSAYQYRYKIAAFKPTVALKQQLGLSLVGDEVKLCQKYGILEQLKISIPMPFDILSGVEEIKSEVIRMTASGVIARLIPPTNKKLVLLDISATRPSAQASGYIHVSRDDVSDVLKLDPYCLQGLSYDYFIRVVALKELLIEWEQLVSGTYPVRIVYGIGRLTLRDKVMWEEHLPKGLEITDEEEKLIEKYELREKVEAGVV